MLNRSSVFYICGYGKKKAAPGDFKQLAKIIVEIATEDKEPIADGKNPAAVALGRLGSKKGGAARAAKLTPEKRSEIAKAAASKRWENKSGNTNAL